MTRRRWAVALLPVLSVAIPLAAFELVMRLLVAPSPRSFGVWRGHELPPVRVVPFKFEPPPSETPDPGTGLTRGDLLGIHREDPEIGYTWKPGARSANGWWQTNALGAISRSETAKTVPEGKRRVLVFGDSFAAGTRVPIESTWTARLGRLRPDLDVVNFGVDGYGIGQALVLERRIVKRIDYDTVLFLFVPWHDAWREVNVSRYLGEGWNSFTPMPRFVLEGDGIRFIPPFYANGTDVYTKDFPEVSRALLDHLRAYDRFFDPSLHDPPPLLSRFMLWKLLAARRGANEQAKIRLDIGSRIDGEAFEICRRILQAAHDEAAHDGRSMAVAVLPTHQDLRNLGKDQAARDRWQSILESIRKRGLATLDLAPALRAAPPDRIDFGADGTHFGPNASAVIAEALAQWDALTPSFPAP